MSTPPVTTGLAPTATKASPSSAAGGVAEIPNNPSSYELPVKSRVVVNQGTLPCCVSTALGAAMEILNPSYPQLAPLFHYYVTRFENRGAKADGFLILEAGLTTLSRNGMCREQLHAQPYTETGISTKPSAEAYADATARALRNRGLLPRYKQAQGPSKVAWIREQLKQNCPIILGFQLPIGYPQFLLSPKFEWLSPDSPPRSMTGHCVLVTGYDDTRQALHIQDSLGEGAFDKGCWWMGYPVVNSTVVSQVYSLIP